jgi:hypothetical protein
MPRAERLGTTASLLMLGLLLSAAVMLPMREVRLAVLGAPLTVRVSGLLQMTVVLATLVSAGVDATLQRHPRYRRSEIAFVPLFWALPAALVFAALVTVRAMPWWGYRVVTVVAAGAGLAAIAQAQYHTIDPDDPHARTARATLNMIAYVVAFLLYAYFYSSRDRTLFAALGVAATGMLVSLEMLRNSPETAWRTWIYAALSGVVMGEFAWALNYWSSEARAGGAVLLIVYYALSGVAQQHLWGRLTRRIVFEYAALGSAGLMILLGVLS